MLVNNIVGAKNMDKTTNDNLITQNKVDIKTMIYTFNGKQVMLDSDLAKLYGYSIKAFNQQVQRNIDRFPSDFMFKVSIDEAANLKSQIVTSSYTQHTHGGKRKPSNIFTEQGVYALSGVLKGPLATNVSISLIRAFKELKDFYIQNSYLLDKVIDIEAKQIEYKKDSDDKFNQIFDYISEHKEVTQKIFYKGQIYDAYSLLIDLILIADREIVLIDNYIDKISLDILSHKKPNVRVSIYTNNNRCIDTDISKFNEEYPKLFIKKINNFHDRFLIIDNKIVYLIGASLKDAGRKCFGITQMDSSNIKNILKEL